MAYACPCCGYLTLPERPPGTYGVCPICCWKDIATETPWDDSSGLSLLEAQRNYLSLGACEEEQLASARQPTETDHRPEGWQTLEEAADAARDRVISQINLAFEEVSRSIGITLHEAEMIDAYGTKEELAKARKLDQESQWQDVPDADIEKCDSALIFLDRQGWRYYIPAYMIWTLRHYRKSASLSSDATIYSLHEDRTEDTRYGRISRFSILTKRQCEAVCSFLKFIRDHGLGYEDDKAVNRALKRYWGRYCRESV